MSFTLGSIGYIEIDISYIRNYICVIIHASCNNDNNNDNNNDDNNDDNDNDDNDDDNDNNYYYIYIYILWNFVDACVCVTCIQLYTYIILSSYKNKLHQLDGIVSMAPREARELEDATRTG